MSIWFPLVAYMPYFDFWKYFWEEDETDNRYEMADQIIWEWENEPHPARGGEKP